MIIISQLAPDHYRDIKSDFSIGNNSVLYNVIDTPMESGCVPT
jgi:hypothetical protein